MSMMPYDPDEWETEVRFHTCPFHRENPRANHPGCTCSSSCTQRRKVDG